MADKDYYSFDEVLADLRMEEDELKRLVSAGEIRAFRDRDTMRFKAEDIERIRSGSRGRGEKVEIDLGGDLDLDDDLGMAPGDELVLEDDGEAADEVDLAAGLEAEDAPRRRSARVAVAAAPEEADEGAGLKFALVLGFLVLLFANFAALGAVSGRTNALTRFLADLFAG